MALSKNAKQMTNKTAMEKKFIVKFEKSKFNILAKVSAENTFSIDPRKSSNEVRFI